MDIKKVYLICFSPTRTSFKIGQAIAGGLGRQVEIMDLTLASTVFSIPADSVAVIAAPVYGGKISPLAVERLSGITGNSTPAVVASVYGNRHYEGALDELAQITASIGFVVVGAGTFVGEHSYSTPDFPIAQGRPNTADLEFARKFGTEIAAKLIASTTPIAIHVGAIEKPKDALISKLKFIYGAIKIKSQKAASARTPTTNAALCSHCGLCVGLCPASAIEARCEDTTGTACIRCCACVKGCPNSARSFISPFAKLLSTNFKTQKSNKTTL